MYTKLNTMVAIMYYFDVEHMLQYNLTIINNNNNIINTLYLSIPLVMFLSIHLQELLLSLAPGSLKHTLCLILTLSCHVATVGKDRSTLNMEVKGHHGAKVKFTSIGVDRHKSKLYLTTWNNLHLRSFLRYLSNFISELRENGKF